MRIQSKAFETKARSISDSLLIFLSLLRFFWSGFVIICRFFSLSFLHFFVTRTETEKLGEPQRSSEKQRRGREKKRKPATRRAGPRRDSTTCASSDGTDACPTSPPRLAGVRQTPALRKGEDRERS